MAAGLAACCGFALAAEPATPVHRPLSARQQLVACMTKQMSASRTISYLEAENVCKMRIQSQNAMLASSAAAGPAAKAEGGQSR
jgi:hypothetical protein